MLGPRGHELIFYSNEGAELEYGENVTILSEAERQAFFADTPKTHNYPDIKWDINEPYWQLFNSRCIDALRGRVRKGDFILSVSGPCHKPIADAFPGSIDADRPGEVLFVEPFVGYTYAISPYVVAESTTHLEWLCGKFGYTEGRWGWSAIPNYWDMREFRFKWEDPPSPYYLFVGRIVDSKGWREAVRAVGDIGGRLVLAGSQGDPGDLPPHVEFVGHVGNEKRNRLMANAIATFCLTRFREPFGGTAVEAQLNGCPAITTDWGAFQQTVAAEWRCMTHREIVDAARRAAKLTAADRQAIRDGAVAKYSLEAVAPQFERYFDRLWSRWGSGYYDMRSALDIPMEADVRTDWETILKEERPQAKRIAEWLKMHHPNDAILDVGCGPGLYVEEMRTVGLNARGVDNDPRLVETDYLLRDDAVEAHTDFLAGVVLSLEVGEHIPEDKAEAYVSYVTASADTIYFSAAQPGQGGNGHINLQPKSYWVWHFHQKGFWLDPDAAAAWIDFLKAGPHMGWAIQNGMVFRRG